MRGRAQSHLMRCDDGDYYVAKFQNNPQGVRFRTLAARIGLPTPGAEVVLRGRETDSVHAGLGDAVWARERASRHIGHCEFTAITEVEPEPDNRRYAFVSRFSGIIASR
jgi:hypothetical protein